ncbi:glycosyltransferase family 4 protein [Rhizobium sp. Root482]|uniref:glycosyltransferase family 4 protein n=1 Tax=Rhizobium sp. Root482 TaxID=1736543 RepID=UPI0006FDD774|nr:glycosyltransferase family 4 protein [Rhizobium sp. Root482]KQY20102.1 glycosyl transferase [Rhizobium sp. Root482]
MRMNGRKILIIVENLPVPFDRRVWQEARALKTAGAQVSVICPQGKHHLARYEYLEGIHVYRHPLAEGGGGAIGYLVEYATALVWETYLAWRIFFRHGFDTIQGCNPPDLIFLIAWQFKLIGKRYVFDHHDINPELYEAKFGRRDLWWRVMVAMEWLTFKTADVVISTNESYKKIAMQRGGKRESDIVVVRSGPDLSRIIVPPPAPKLKRGRDFLVGYVGVMGEQEGIDLLLEVVHHIVFTLGRRDIQFTLVGGGPSLVKLQALSKELGVEDYVEFMGRAPDDILFRLLSTSDICVNPDRVNEMNDKSTMNKILEYMAFSKPIVQFDVTEGRYTAQEASLYARPNDTVDFADKIMQLLADPGERQRRGAIGRRRIVEELSWEFEAPKYIRAHKI